MLPLSIILLLVCIGLSTYYFFQLRQRYQYFIRLGIPTPPFHFFFGHLKTLWNSGSFHRQLENWTKQYGKIYGIYQGTVPTFIVSDPDFLQEVFVKQFGAFMGRNDFFSGGRAQNVFTSSAATWRRHRHVLNPTFSAAKLKLMSPLINGCITDVMEKLVDHVNSESEFNIYTYYKRMTMDVICKCILMSCFQQEVRRRLRFFSNLQISLFALYWNDDQEHFRRVNSFKNLAIEFSSNSLTYSMSV